MSKKTHRISVVLKDEELRRQFKALCFLLEKNTQEVLELSIKSLYSEKIAKNEDLSKGMNLITSYLEDGNI